MTYDYFYGQQAEMFAFYRVPKVLFTEDCFWNVSTDAKLLYGILLDRMNLSARNGWLDEEGRVYIIFTIEEIKGALGCAVKEMRSDRTQATGTWETEPDLCKELHFRFCGKTILELSKGQFWSCQKHNSRTVKSTR